MIEYASRKRPDINPPVTKNENQVSISQKKHRAVRWGRREGVKGITMFEEIKKLLFRKRKPRPAPKPDPEQEREDEEQAAYLAEWSRRHKKKDQR